VAGRALQCPEAGVPGRRCGANGLLLPAGLTAYDEDLNVPDIATVVYIGGGSELGAADSRGARAVISFRPLAKPFGPGFGCGARCDVSVQSKGVPGLDWAVVG
jgi:hypothetical protein